MMPTARAPTVCLHRVHRAYGDLRGALRCSAEYDAETRAALDAAAEATRRALDLVRRSSRSLAIAAGNRERAAKRREMAERRAAIAEAVRRMDLAVNGALAGWERAA